MMWRLYSLRSVWKLFVWLWLRHPVIENWLRHLVLMSRHCLSWRVATRVHNSTRLFFLLIFIKLILSDTVSFLLEAFRKTYRLAYILQVCTVSACFKFFYFTLNNVNYKQIFYLNYLLKDLYGQQKYYFKGPTSLIWLLLNV